jgi:hypothetical protein
MHGFMNVKFIGHVYGLKGLSNIGNEVTDGMKFNSENIREAGRFL